MINKIWTVAEYCQAIVFVHEMNNYCLGSSFCVRVLSAATTFYQALVLFLHTKQTTPNEHR